MGRTAVASRRVITRTAVSARDAGSLMAGLIDWWNFEEATGYRWGVKSTRMDTAGTVTSGAGLVGNGVVTASGNNYLQVPVSHATALHAGAGGFTTMLWVNLAAYSVNVTQYLVSRYGTNNREWLVYLPSATGGQVRLYASWDGTNTAWAGTAWPAPTTGAWHCVFAWWVPADRTIYLSVDNGTPATKAYDHDALWVTDNVPLTVGAFANAIQGTADNFATWNRALTAAERAWCYYGGRGRGAPWLQRRAA